MERICENCSKKYQTPPSQRPRFCSHKCASMAKRTGKEVPCAMCGKTIWRQPKTNRRYCSKSCARSAINLTDANPAHKRDITGPNNPMYGVRRKGTENPMYGKRREACPRWNGGRKVRSDGYVIVVAPDDHPHPCDEFKGSGLKYVLEHRLVMEKKIGRYLKNDEVVHHIDGNPSNNSPENLQLMERGEHASMHARR